MTVRNVIKINVLQFQRSFPILGRRFEGEGAPASPSTIQKKKTSSSASKLPTHNANKFSGYVYSSVSSYTALLSQ